MRKFKVGDRVVDCEYMNLPGTVTGVSGDAVYVHYDGDEAPSMLSWPAAHFRPAAPAPTNDNSPIRTRREIVPGTYGEVQVEGANQHGVFLWMPHYMLWTPAELREAAHLFNQIAEVLEEQAREAA